MKEKTKHASHDPRVRHAGKAGSHAARDLNLKKGRTRKWKHRARRGW